MSTEFASLFASIDAMDPEAFAGHLADDAVFTYGSQAPVAGRDAIRSYVAAFFAAFAALSHRVLVVHRTADGVAVVEGEVTYRMRDGRSVTLPFANVFRLRGRLISDYRIYIDPSPLSR